MRVRLELREPGAEAEDEALELLCRDDHDRRPVHAGGREARRPGCSRRRTPAQPASVRTRRRCRAASVKRVAVLIAVMICRVMQSSAKLRKDVSLSERKSRTAL